MTLGVNILKCYEKKYTTEIEAYFCYVFTKEKKKTGQIMKPFLKAEEFFLTVNIPIVKHCPLTGETRINAIRVGN